MERPVDVLLHGTQYKQLMGSRIAALREYYGLRKIDVEILYYLYQCGGRNTSRDIQETHMFTKGHISQSVERLQKMRLLSCIPDQRDRRCVHFQLTEDADEIVQAISRMWEEMTSIIFEGVTEDEKRVLQQVAGKMARNMELAVERAKSGCPRRRGAASGRSENSRID